MVRIPENLEGARLNVTETAELINMETGHFRRLVRRGVFPAAKKTAKRLPYYDHPLLIQIAEIVKRKIGANGEEIMWHRRKPRNQRPTRPRRHARGPQQAEQQAAVDEYVEAIIEGCRQLGVEEDRLAPAAITEALAAEFGQERPALEQSIPAVARRLLGAE